MPPRTAVYTSAEERQRNRQTYYATSEKEAGIAHLWHLQRLADIRLNPNHTIRDVPDVDFQSRDCPTDVYRELYADRFAQQVRHDEAQVYAENQKIFRHLVQASDDKARRARNMNLVPTEQQVDRFDNIQQQTMNRMQDRRRRQRAIAADNEKLLSHLMAVPPNVRTTKELDAWYHTVHKKRLAQVSRFKPAESYAGERILEGSASNTRRSNSRGGGFGGSRSGRHASQQRAGEVSAAPPLLRGQPYPPPSIADAARTAPAALLPAMCTTSYGGVPLIGPQHHHHTSYSATVSDTGVTHITSRPVSAQRGGGGRGEGAAQPRLSGLRLQRPEWQSISATDIPLLHYAADVELRGGAVHRPSGSGGPQRQSLHDSRSSTGSPAPTSPLPESLPYTPSPPPRPQSGGHMSSAAAASRHVTIAATTNDDFNPADDVPRVTARGEGGVTQLWRRAVAQQHNRGGSGSGSANKKRHLTFQGDQQCNPWRAPSARETRGAERQTAATRTRATSPTPPSAAAASPSPPPPPPPGYAYYEAADGDGADEAEGSRESEEAAAVRELMEGWRLRSEGGHAAYAPI